MPVPSPMRDAHDPHDAPDPFDAVTAAPAHHLRLLENPHVRVLETRIAPGESVPLHAHAWPAVHYFLSAGHIVRRDAQGRVEYDSRQNPTAARAGQALWSPPLTAHTLENVGATEIHVITVEVKQRE
jgi:quercetin dioxygenase-like cupin family protein